MGRLFMLSLGGGEASLISVGRTADELVATSRLVAPRVESVQRESRQVPSYPRLRRKLLEARAMACGGAAVSFDPLFGEGAGNVAREAFLAAVVVRAALAGEDEESLGQRYTSRLVYGFQRHLEVCLRFYKSGGTAEFWREECDKLEEGIAQLVTCRREFVTADAASRIGILPLDRPSIG